MSIKGSAESYIELRGSLSKLDAIHGKSAYEVAVANGFKGSVTLWLESLKGGGVNVDAVREIVYEIIGAGGGGGGTAAYSLVKTRDVELRADAWIADNGYYYQEVEIDGVTEYSQVDLTPSVEQLVIFSEKDIAFVTENDGGTITVYAIGQKPQNDYTIQATIIETDINSNAVRIGEVELLADAWEGEASPYSQIVELEGITENSQVDLTPSVSDLVIFHEKDLAFVTENNGGTVTVYAIGQKPQNDYTIQVTITEVDA